MSCIFIYLQPGDEWSPDACTTCLCENNTEICVTDEGCTVSTTSPTTSSIITTSSGTTFSPSAADTTTKSTDISPTHHDVCQWTDWINVDVPEIGTGDMEVLTLIRLTHAFCDNPIFIECRVSSTKVESSKSGQIVQCDLQLGLKCRNADNEPEGCLDYEVRFFCFCSSSNFSTFYECKICL